MEYESLTAHINKLVSLTDEEISIVHSYFTLKKFKKHQFLVNVGDVAKYSYFVVSGLLKLNYTDDNGKSHIVSFAMEDWWESDFYSFFLKQEATLSLECLEDTKVLCITLDDYWALCNRVSKMERLLLIKANFGFLSSQKRILSLLSSDSKERYEAFLKQYPQLIQRIPKSLIASYIGVSRETLSRLSI